MVEKSLVEIIRDGSIQNDDWVRLGDEDPIPAIGHVIVSLDRLRREGEVLRAGHLVLGVEILGDSAPEEVAEELRGISLIVIKISTFKDGRVYSLARLLRGRFGFHGELRARGDVLPDQIFYLHRCGFSSFEVRPDKSIEQALAALSTFSVTYQGSADDPRPLYRRVGR